MSDTTEPTSEPAAESTPAPTPAPPQHSDLVDTTPPDAPTPTLVLPTAAPRPHRKGLIRGLIIGGGALVLVLIGLGIAYAVETSAHAPEKTVVAFLDKLVKGHATTAAAQLDPKPTTDTSLLTDKAYAAIQDGRVTKYTILSSKESGGSAQVKAKLTAGDKSWVETFHLDSTGQDLLWNVWAVDGRRLARIDVSLESPAGLELTVNGLDLGLKSDTTLAAFPGTYSFEPSKTPGPFTTDPQDVSVDAFGDVANNTAAFTASLTDDGKKAANLALTRFIDGCIAQHSLHPAGKCGYSIIDDGTVFNTINWTLTVRPVAGFDAYDGTGFNVTTTTKGVFDIRAENSRVIATSTVTDYEFYGYILFDADGKVSYESDYTP